MSLTNNNNTRRGGPPPFEQLEQRNRDITRNTLESPFIFQPSLSAADFSETWWSNNTQPVNDYAGEQLREEWRAKYRQWRHKVLAARKEELNSNFSYFKFYQNKWSRSIELQLLEAISDGKELETRTTSYSPSTGIVSLHKNPIVWIDTEHYTIKQVAFPEIIKGAANLLRHRFRQLGIRCVVVKGVNRLYLTKDYWVPLAVGEIKEISSVYNIVCLPKKWYEVNIVDLPRQSDLFSEEWTGLSQFTGTVRNHECWVFAKVKGSIIHLQVKTNSRDASKTSYSKCRSLNVSELNSERNIIKDLVRRLKNEVVDESIRNQIITEEKEYKRKGYSTSGITGPGITWTIHNNMNTVAVPTWATTTTTTTATIRPVTAVDYVNINFNNLDLFGTIQNDIP